MFLARALASAPVHSDARELNLPGKDLLLSKLRDPRTDHAEFRAASNRMLRLLLEEVLGNEPFITSTRETSTGASYEHKELEFEKRYCVVVILRSGASMLSEAISIIPEAKVGFILIQRDESSADKRPVFVYSKLPSDITSLRVLLIDPMLATGGSSSKAIDILKQAGVPEGQIVFVNLISCSEGIANLEKIHPGVTILTAKIDPTMNSHKYIVPGLGDFGDRYYGTN